MATASVTAGKGLIYPALRKAGVTLGPQRTPSPAQYQDGLEELNRLTASLSLDRLNIYTVQRQEFPLTTGKNTYTIGEDAAADFNTPRPIAIESANIVNAAAGGFRTPLTVLTHLQWAMISLQNAGFPTAIYDDEAFPVSTLYLFGSQK